MAKKINNIKEELNKSSLQVAALALYLDVEDTTISKWNSNKYQPSLNKIDDIGDILEIDNTNLILSIKRESTGLADALQKEYKRLLQTGMPKKVKVKDAKSEEKEINNPEFVSTLRDFVEKYKKEKAK
ncbi:hypothetical protein H8S90_13830 [Olivibacter sp. SDN3]|uniref:hypothetical protein n=1 Tax=Olivibacter sp. SDN3 TaxID=2764720 RepID=UPI001650DACE|nr:hypothetical protein [Olivibacter sp. SDN3]QNL47898.1 hypothetical protein H8S90_13830 [Olivibacter sp. SDN3]